MSVQESTISARSRLEAMDWSLVLISQGIESSVHQSDEGLGWNVCVSPGDYLAATEAIRIYRVENRNWGLRREVFQAGMMFDWVSIVWAALVCLLYWLNDWRVDLKTPGILDTAAVSQGQWWRLFTAIWLHADLAHLASNCTFGLLLLGLAMGRYGTGVGLLAAYLSGVGGNVLSWACEPQRHFGLGASGMVMGCLGLLAAQSVSLWRKTPHSGGHFLGSLFAGLMLFLLLGVTPGTDVVAHLGGFVAGLITGSLLAFKLRAWRKAGPNVASALLFVVLVLWPWLLALRGTR